MKLTELLRSENKERLLGLINYIVTFPYPDHIRLSEHCSFEDNCVITFRVYINDEPYVIHIVTSEKKDYFLAFHLRKSPFADKATERNYRRLLKWFQKKY